jgi:hypothetical protein
MLVAEADGRIVGLRAFMRWRLGAGDREVRAVRAVDTATHPDFQGRGIFSRLTREALDALQGEIDLVFNTPNSKSLPGYLKRGWNMVGRVPVWTRVRRPLRWVRGVRSAREGTPMGGTGPPVHAAPAAQALRAAEGLSVLLAEADLPDVRLATPRDPAYLGWRYADAPHLDYRAVHSDRGGRLDGLAIFRVRPRGRLWESTVAEVLVRPGDVSTARQLFRAVAGAAPVDHVTCSFPRGWSSRRALPRSRFVRVPGGITLVARPLRDVVDLRPFDIRSWALSLGDVEVF